MNEGQERSRRVARRLRLDPTYLATDEEKALHIAARADGWADVLDALAVSCAGVIKGVAYDRADWRISDTEARSAAVRALLDACDGFSADGGASFRTYARHRMVHAVTDDANKVMAGVEIKERTLRRYYRLVEFCDSVSEITEHAREFGLKPATAVRIHQWMTGQRSMDDDRPTVSDDGDDNGGARDRLESAQPYHWDNTPDLSPWEVMEGMPERQARALRLFSEGVEVTTIAERLGVSRSTAHRDICTGLEEIRRNIRDS